MFEQIKSHLEIARPGVPQSGGVGGGMEVQRAHHLEANSSQIEAKFGKFGENSGQLRLIQANSGQLSQIWENSGQLSQIRANSGKWL